MINENINEKANENENVSPSLPSSGEDTHTGTLPPSENAGARAGWFDPERPERPCDSAWRTSPQARSAIAQRIIDHLEKEHGLDTGIIDTEMPGLHRLICLCMEAGMPPGEITLAGQTDGGEGADQYAEELVLTCQAEYGGMAELAEPIMARQRERQALIRRIQARKGGGCRDDP